MCRSILKRRGRSFVILAIAAIAALVYLQAVHTALRVEREHQLVTAVERHDVTAVERLLRAGASPNAMEFTPAPASLIERIKWILSGQHLGQGAMCVLELAVMGIGDDDRVHYLPQLPSPTAIFRELSLDQITQRADTTPQTIAYWTDAQICCDLIEAGANVNHTTYYGGSLLAMAIERRKCHAAHGLIQHGAQFNSHDYGTVSAESVIQLQFDDIDSLLHAGAFDGYMDAHTSRTATLLTSAPLRAAIAASRSDVAKLLISNRVDIDGVTDVFGTPLHVALWCGNWDVARLLLARHANPNVVADLFGTPLHMMTAFLTISDIPREQRETAVLLRNDILSAGGYEKPAKGRYEITLRDRWIVMTARWYSPRFKDR